MHSPFFFSYVDNFAFCCIVGLQSADSASSTGCHAPKDQFSSCDDLLQDGTLRAFMWILGLSALVGNGFVIGLRVFREKDIKGSQTQSRLITHLAVSDLLMGVYMLIIASADSFYRGVYAINADSWRGGAACQLAGFMSAFSSEVSVLIIMLISVDRLICVVFSHHRVIKLTNRNAMISLAVIWGLAFLISLIPALVFKGFYGRSSVCLGLPLTADRPPGWPFSFMMFVVLNCLCFLITACCYIAIFVKIHKTTGRIARMTTYKSKLQNTCVPELSSLIITLKFTNSTIPFAY